MPNDLAGSLGNWKEYYQKIGDKEVWGRAMVIEVLEWAVNIKLFVPHMNANLRILILKRI